MKTLKDLVTLVTNTEDCVVLKVKEGVAMNLICLGCFDGDETMFRLTKGPNITCTVWSKSGHSFSWFWGDRGYTLVSDKVDKMGKLIQECIEMGFDILCKGSIASIKKDMSKINHMHTICVWDRDKRGTDWGCRKDNEYCNTFKTLAAAIKYFESYGYTVHLQRHYTTQIGFDCYEYIIVQ